MRRPATRANEKSIVPSLKPKKKSAVSRDKILNPKYRRNISTWRWIFSYCLSPWLTFTPLIHPKSYQQASAPSPVLFWTRL